MADPDGSNPTPADPRPGTTACSGHGRRHTLPRRRRVGCSDDTFLSRSLVPGVGEQGGDLRLDNAGTTAQTISMTGDR